jgi:hypothetical protein
MSTAKKILSLVIVIALLNAGCQIPMGFTSIVVGTETERVPKSTGNHIESEVQTAPGNQAILTLTRVQEDEVRTIELQQKAKRSFDLTGLCIAAGFGAGILFIVLLIVAINNGGLGGGGGDDDWD